MLITKEQAQTSHKILRCHLCKRDDGYLAWRDDSETQSSIVCVSCGKVIREFRVEFVEGRKVFATDDELIKLLVYNIRVQDTADLVAISGDYELPENVAEIIQDIRKGHDNED